MELLINLATAAAFAVLGFNFFRKRRDDTDTRGEAMLYGAGAIAAGVTAVMLVLRVFGFGA